MSDIIKNDVFRRQVMYQKDLQLLIVFDAIMTEGSITRAASQLATTQPAVSNALAKMRDKWGDELFVKDGRGVQPTLFASNLWGQIREPLLQLSAALSPDQFDPGVAKRTFRISASDAIVSQVWPQIRKTLSENTSSINVYAVPYRINNLEPILANAEVDLVIGSTPLLSDIIHQELLYTPKMVCVMKPDNPLLSSKITISSFAQAEHLLVSLSGGDTGFTDQALSERGMKRRVSMTVNHFSTAIELLENSNLISVMPVNIVSKAIEEGRLTAIEPPIPISANSIAMYWHTRQEKDQGLIWLKNLIREIISKDNDQYVQC